VNAIADTAVANFDFTVMVPPKVSLKGSMALK
jgi:hypothetical protein